MNWTCARREHDLALLRMFVRFHARCGRLHSSDSKISRGLGHVMPLKHLIAGSLEVKLPTYGQMQQQLCEQRRERVSGKKIRKEKESEKRNSRQKKEDQSTRKGGKVAKHCFSIFFPFFPTFWGTHLSYIGFLSWKLPPPPRAVLLVIMTTGSKLREIVNQIIKMVLPCSSCFGPELIAKQIHTGSNLCGAHCRERQHFLTWTVHC